MDKLQEVAQLLHLDEDGKEYRRFCPDNDSDYRRYTRLLRKYDVFMPFQTHECWWCTEPITLWYEAYVYVARPPVWIPQLKRYASFWVEKHHYPECPDREREFEEEMRAQWAEKDRVRKEAERKAA